jgi:hypothetical protein
LALTGFCSTLREHSQGVNLYLSEVLILFVEESSNFIAKKEGSAAARADFMIYGSSRQLVNKPKKGGTIGWRREQNFVQVRRRTFHLFSTHRHIKLSLINRVKFVGRSSKRWETSLNGNKILTDSRFSGRLVRCLVSEDARRHLRFVLIDGVQVDAADGHRVLRLERREAQQLRCLR